MAKPETARDRVLQERTRILRAIDDADREVTRVLASKDVLSAELKGIDAALAAMGDRAKRPKVVAP